MTELEQKADKILDMVIKGIELGVEQAPGIAQEYVSYFMIRHVGSGIAFISASLILSVFIYLGVRFEFKNDDYVRNGMGYFAASIAAICFTITMAMALEDIISTVQLTMAPKAYMIEKVRK